MVKQTNEVIFQAGEGKRNGEKTLSLVEFEHMSPIMISWNYFPKQMDP